MKTLHFGRISVAALITLFISGLPAHADEGTAPDEILITGLRTPIPVGDMATAVTIIDREALDLRQSFQLADVLRDVPGLTVARSGSVGSQAQIRMRGAEANHILVLIDGVEANDPASGDEFLFEHLSAMEVERIEIIRGPQSALWGSDAVAGVINIVTRKAVDGFSGGASAEGGSNNTWRQSLRAAYGADNWRFTLGASRSETDGTNVSRLGDEDDGYSLMTVQARLQFEPSDTLSLDFTARRVEASNEFDPIDFLVTGLPVDGDRVNEAERWVFGGVATVEAGGLSHKAGVNWLDSENLSFADGVSQGTTGAERFKVFYQATMESVQGHRVTGAVDYRDTEFTQTGAASFFGDPNQVQSMTNTAYVLDYVGDVTGSVTVTASARYDDNSDFDNITTWRLGASWDLSDEMRLRGSYGRGYKAPTFIERFGFFSDTFIGNPNLMPEISDSYEFGIDHVALEGRVLVGLTYFNARLEDEIDGFAWDPVNFAFTAVNKQGESKRQGVEATLDIQLTDQLAFSSNYTWTDAEEPDGMGGFRRELRRPEHSGAVALTWQGATGAAVSVNGSWVGDAEDIFFPPWPMPSEIVTLGDYALVNIAGHIPLNDTVEIFGRVEKALNSNYEDVLGFATPDIGFFGGIRVRF